MLNELTAFRSVGKKSQIQIVNGFYTLTRKCESTASRCVLKAFRTWKLPFQLFWYRKRFSASFPCAACVTAPRVDCHSNSGAFRSSSRRWCLSASLLYSQHRFTSSWTVALNTRKSASFHLIEIDCLWRLWWISFYFQWNLSSSFSTFSSTSTSRLSRKVGRIMWLIGRMLNASWPNYKWCSIRIRRSKIRLRRFLSLSCCWRSVILIFHLSCSA